MLFYTKSLQPAPGILLIDFSYGRRMSHVTVESLYLHDHLDKLSYEYPSDNSETGSLDRSSIAPSPDVDKSKDFVIFSPNHGQDQLQPGCYSNIVCNTDTRNVLDFLNLILIGKGREIFGEIWSNFGLKRSFCMYHTV